MKKILILLVSIFIFNSCNDEDDSIKDLEIVVEKPMLKYSGNFIPTFGINVNGNSKIYLEGNTYKLKLENFTISDGPDLKVYLSKSDTPIDFINLGPLVIGSNLMYNIPNSVNFKEYKYVLIHCQQYNHLFATSNLIMI